MMQLKSYFARAPSIVQGEAEDRPLPSGPAAPSTGLNRARPVAELVLIFAVLVGIDHRIGAGEAFAGVDPHPFWLPVLLMAVAYGSGMGLLAAIMATVTWVVDHDHLGNGDHLQKMLSLSILPMLWVTTALVIGEISSSRLIVIRKLRRHRTKLKSNQHKLVEMIGDLAKTNRALQVRIATDGRTIGDAVVVALDIIDAGPVQKIAGLERLVKLAAKGAHFTFYEVVGGTMRPLFCGSGARSDLSWDDVAGSATPRDLADDGAVIAVSPDCLVVPVYADGNPLLFGVLAIEGIGNAPINQSTRAAIVHVARSLGRLAPHLHEQDEATPQLSRWLLAQDHAA